MSIQDEGGGASSATDVSLREYLMQAILASRAECKEGIRVLTEKFTVSERTSDEAIRVALTSIDKRFDGVNEFRGALEDLSGQMATKSDLSNLADKMLASREQLETRFDGFYQRNRSDIEDIKKRLDVREGVDQGARLTKGSLYAAMAAGVAVVGLLVVVANYFTGQ